MLQIENEFGYVSSTPQHSQNLVAMWKELRIESEFYIEDAA
jgi:hypothetical protein